jgi:Dolichyl-phosphate-mannose-protein mannosyltransferase
VERAVRVHAGELNPRFFNWPSLYMYVLAGVYGLVFGAAPDGVAGAFARDPALFYLVGRLVTAVFGTATLAVLYCTGRMAYGPAVGILAAGLLAVDLLHVRDSHWVTPDVPLTFLVALATHCALRYWRDGRRADAGAAGLVVGLAAAMKYPGALAFLGLVVAHAARHPGSAAWRRVAGKDTIAAAGLASIGFLLGTPFALLTPAAFARGALAELREVHTVQFGNEADAPAYLFHLVYSLPEAMGWPLYLLGLAGLGWALAVRGAREVVLLAFAVPYLLVIVTWSARFERYAIPLLPCLTLLAAAALTRGVGWLSGRRWLMPPWPAIALVSATALLVGPALLRVAAYHRLLAEPDTREVGSAWVERHVPPGSRIALQPYSLSLPVARQQLREEPGSWGLEAPRPVGSTTAPAGSQDGYWLLRLHAYDLDRLEGAGVQYVVLSGFVFQRHRQACRWHPDPCRFYAALDARAQLVFSASPGVPGVEDGALLVGDIYSPLTRLRERRHPGPPIRVYRLRAGGRA